MLSNGEMRDSWRDSWADNLGFLKYMKRCFDLSWHVFSFPLLVFHLPQLDLVRLLDAQLFTFLISELYSLSSSMSRYGFFRFDIGFVFLICSLSFVFTAFSDQYFVKLDSDISSSLELTDTTILSSWFPKILAQDLQVAIYWELE